MPRKTNLNTSPYFNDFDVSKQYYHIGFKPGFGIQNRELHHLQDQFQTQLERFGDNIFVQGTILEGCNFIFYDPQPYIKLQDTLADATSPTIPSQYIDLNIESPSTGLKAYVVDSADGFESQDPDLKTLYLKYINSGTDSNTFAFTAGETLNVYDLQRSISDFTINNGGIAFSNSDSVIITSALVVNVTSGTFSNGDYINDGGDANVQIVGVDTTTLADTGKVIWSIKPREDDLTNATITSAAWTIANGAALADAGATATADVERLIGSGLEAIIRTNATGRITSVSSTSNGAGYTTAPQLTVKSANNATGVSALDIDPLNYKAQVVVSTVSEAVGNGYAFGVTDGVIYQKGYFLKVNSQRVTVSKYSTTPNAISVGFDSVESIVNADQDTTLFDNATGEPNETAPGADRLKIVPTLTAVASNTANANPEFFTLVEFSEGRPFKQNKTTQYNKINDEMARRTKEESGDYVTDKFIVSTSSPANSAIEANSFTVKVDPGAAYVDGYRVRTEATYSQDVARTTETRSTSQSISLNYGNYVVVDNAAGFFQFSTGDVVDLYDTAHEFLANTDLVAAGTITPSGSKIGEARIRSMVPLNNISPESSQTGAADSAYRLYLFDIIMNAGRNFSDTKAVFYDGTAFDGIADVVTVVQGTTNTAIAELADRQRSKLLFYSGVQSIQNANAINYTYRTIKTDTVMSNNGQLVYNISGTPDEFFVTTGALSNSELQKLYVAPVGGDLIAADNLTGTFDSNTSTNTWTGAGTNFLNELVAGDYLTVSANSTGGSQLRQVTKIINSTAIQVDKVGEFSNAVATGARTFPRYVPIPFGSREGLTGNVDANGNIMTLTMQYHNANDFNIDTGSSTNTALGVNINRTAAARKTKTPQRNRFVKIRLANNAGGTSGPWCLGIPDVFRVRAVYKHDDSTVNTNSTNVLNQCYVDHNQNENYYGLSYLYARPRNNMNLASDDYLLVEFDHFTESGAGGFFDAISYVSSNTTQRVNTDSANLATITGAGTVHSFEIPQIVADSGINYDLINQFDFRPYVVNTVATGSNATNAPLNPANTRSFGTTSDPANDKKFPLPDSIMTATVSQFLSRVDSIFLDRNADFSIVSGKPGSNTLNSIPPEPPNGALKIVDLFVPPYPNAPIKKSEQFKEIINTKVANIRYLYDRFVNRTIERVKSADTSTTYTQPVGYTMADINKLEKRISDLEYYMGLSLLESDLKDRVIPSSNDPQLNRFKFGFFVDDFSDYLRLDAANPRFNAQIEQDDLVPPLMSWVAYFDQSTINNGDYIEEILVNQINSSDPADAVEPSCLPNTQIANAIALRTNFNSQQVGNTVSSFVDNFSVQLAGGASEVTPGEVTFVNSSATLFYYAYDKNVKVEIYQGSTLLASTANAVALSNTDKVFVQSEEASNWFVDEYDTYGIDTTVSTDYANYMGKIEFTHNPNLGRNYTVRVYKGADSFRWKTLFQYPIDRSTVGCPPPPPGEPGTPGVPGRPGTPGIPGAPGAVRQVTWGGGNDFQESGDAGSDP